MKIQKNDKERIRELAAKVSEIAKETRMEMIMRRWRDVNALRKPDRAPVWCRPVGCWKEIIPDSKLLCTEPWLRRLEYNFLQTLHKREIDDDSPVTEYITVNAVFRCEPANVWGVDIGRHESDTKGGAWGYDPPLKNAEDFDKLRIPSFTYDEKATLEQVERLSELLGGIMPVKLAAAVPLGATLGTAAADLRGLEQMMMDMVMEPELMHRLMSVLRDSTLSSIRKAEESGLLSPNNSDPMTCSDPIGEPDEDGKATCKNLWCMANSQEFDQVSPEMWEEFCLNYQKPIFEHFGLVCYGCCENLTHKIDGVLSIPNLRIFTCSAWTTLSAVLEKVGRNYCIMWRQKASDVVFSKDKNSLRQDLLDGARQLQGSYYQIVLRELETLDGQPDLLHQWTRYAKEAAEKYA